MAIYSHTSFFDKGILSSKSSFVGFLKVPSFNNLHNQLQELRCNDCSNSNISLA